MFTLWANGDLCKPCALLRLIELSGHARPAPSAEEQRLIQERRLSALHPSLRSILSAELEQGNSVVSTSEGWPEKRTIFVSLRKPFLVKLPVLPDGVEYYELNDVHYWKAHYEHKPSGHMLVY